MSLAPLGIKLAKTAGFCMGVKRAVELALDIARKKGSRRVFSYGPLIHNPQTMELLAAQGVEVIQDLESLPADVGEAFIIIRAHGIPPEERQKIKTLGCRIIDATCPRVAYVQAIIKKHAARGRTIVIVGDSSHPEVNGLLGFARAKGLVVGNPEEALLLDGQDGPFCVVAQTTQEVEQYRKVCDVIRNKDPEAVFFDTICDSTAKRQEEVVALAAEMEAMIIVGGRNSANTNRLAELCRREGTTVVQIETAGELGGQLPQRFRRIGVSAGASTPNWIIDQVLEKLVIHRGLGRPLPRMLLRFWLWTVKNDLFAALGAAALTYAGSLFFRAPLSWSPLLVASLYVLGMHAVNRYLNYRLSGTLGSFRGELYIGRERRLLGLAALAVTASLILSLTVSGGIFLLLLLVSLLGGIYYVPLFPRKLRFSSLKDLPGSKNLAMALAWATTTTSLAAVNSPKFDAFLVVFFFAFVFYLVFSRSVIADIWDIQSDRLKGRETIPVVLGIGAVKRLLLVLFLPLALTLGLAILGGGAPAWSLFLLMCVFYVWICLYHCDRELGVSNFVKEGLLETNYLIAAGLALAGWWVSGSV